MKNLLFVILCVLIAAVIIGCSETEDPVTTEFTADDAAFGTVGEMKTTMDAAPAAPSAPTDGTPFVKSVGYYSDWQLTEQLADGAEVPVGTLVYIHIQFSEPMAHRNTDNEEQKVARPILYYWVNSELIRFRVMPHGSQGDDFVSGDAKPKGGGTDDYVCKYRVKVADNGSQFWIRVGKWSVDLEGNPLADSYIHTEKLWLGERESKETQPKQPEPTLVEEKKEPKPSEKEEPEPIEISYYADWNFTEPIIEEVSPGDTIHTKVVFAERVPVVFTDDHTARPAIFYTVGGRESQYRMKIRDVHSGDAKTYGSDKIFLCIYTVRQQDIGQMFNTHVGEISGGPLTIVERKQPIAPVPEPEPAFTIPEIEPVVIPPRSLDFYIHGDGTSDRDTEYRGIVPSPEDFGGYVLIPKFRPNQAIRLSSQPIAGVTVTITAGPHAGKRVVTDENGQYIFKGVREDTLRLRVEGEHLETKEVIVYRSGPTALVDGVVPNYYGDPQRIPGNILIGQRWPDAIRPLLQQVPIVYDHLFIVADLDKERSVGGYGVAGSYNSGVVIIGNNYVNQRSPKSILEVFAHEIAHMRQHALVSPDGSGDIYDWINSPEGRAFAEARQKDWDDFGKTWIDDPISHYLPLEENAAEICARYWFGDNRIPAPNRYKWAEEWLNK